jgi:hypothetical protein
LEYHSAYAGEMLVFHFDAEVAVSSLVKLPRPPFPFGLSFRQMSDKALKGISRFDTLRALLIDHTEVGDEGLEEVEHLRELRVLGLNETPATDEGLFAVGGLTQLVSLSLWRGGRCELG